MQFYFLFEASLIPIRIIILGIGYQPERLPATFAIVIYTVVASLPLMLCLVTQARKRTFSLISRTYSSSPTAQSRLLALGLLLGFLVKFPIFFLHLWLPKAHVEAPLLGSMILAALLLKLGGYGM